MTGDPLGCARSRSPATAGPGVGRRSTASAAAVETPPSREPEASERFVYSFHGWSPREERRREALCTLANGWMGSRGAAAEVRAGEHCYPGTYLSGGYNRLQSSVHGRTFVHEDLVNAPNWLPLTMRPVGGRWLDLGSVEVLEYRQDLDLRSGLLCRRFRFRDQEGRRTRVTSERHLHLEDAHRASLQWTVTAENWHGELELSAGLDGGVANTGVERYRARRGRHLEVQETGTDDGVAWLLASTVDSRITIAEAFRLDLSAEGVGVALWEGRPPREAARRAVVAAALAVTGYGSRTDYPTRDQIEELLLQRDGKPREGPLQRQGVR